MRGIELQNDSPLRNQKFVLLQYASRTDSYTKGETVGLKICGSYPTEEAALKAQEEMMRSGAVYFPIEVQHLGEWLAFPDFANDERQPQLVAQQEGEGGRGGDFQLEEMYAQQEENRTKLSRMSEERYQIIKNGTYLSQPESVGDLESLVALIVQALHQFYNDYSFYKDASQQAMAAIKTAPERREEEAVELDEERDYLALNREESEAAALFSFTDSSTRQRSDAFAFKVRGIFKSNKDFERRKALLLQEDKNLDIYRFPVGVWAPFNETKSDTEALSDLNQIVGERMLCKVAKDKAFKKRIAISKMTPEEREKKGLVLDDRVVLTREELQKSLDGTLASLRKTHASIQEYHTMLRTNLQTFKSMFKVPVSALVKEEVTKMLQNCPLSVVEKEKIMPAEE